MRISNVQLDITLETVYVLLDRFAAYDTDVEIVNCPGKTKHDSFNVRLFRYLCNFTLQGCSLSFKYLRNIIVRAMKGESIYCLSHNNFENKDWNFIDEISEHFVIFPEYINIQIF